MKNYFTAVFILFGMHLNAQQNTNHKGLQIDLGGGLTIQKFFTNVYTGSTPLVANFAHLNLKYRNEFLGYGIKLEKYKFFTDTDSSTVFRNAASSLIQFNTTAYLYDGPKLGFYLSAGLGGSQLTYSQLDSSGTFAEIKIRGFSGSLHAGINYHFKGKFGIFLQLGFNVNNEIMKEVKVNGNNREYFENRLLEDVLFTRRGFDLKTGIRFAF